MKQINHVSKVCVFITTETLFSGTHKCLRTIMQWFVYDVSMMFQRLLWMLQRVSFFAVRLATAFANTVFTTQTHWFLQPSNTWRIIHVFTYRLMHVHMGEGRCMCIHMCRGRSTPETMAWTFRHVFAQRTNVPENDHEMHLSIRSLKPRFLRTFDFWIVFIKYAPNWRPAFTNRNYSK